MKASGSLRLRTGRHECLRSIPRTLLAGQSLVKVCRWVQKWRLLLISERFEVRRTAELSLKVTV